MLNMLKSNQIKCSHRGRAKAKRSENITSHVFGRSEMKRRASLDLVYLIKSVNTMCDMSNNLLKSFIQGMECMEV